MSNDYLSENCCFKNKRPCHCFLTNNSCISEVPNMMTFKKPSKTKQPDSVEHAYNYAIFLLGLSMRTEFEMRRKMAVRGYQEDVIEAVITQLYQEKLLDDRHYAEVYINNLKEYRTLGYYGIKKK